jgi:apolipoprotein N-acyltransferase
MRLLPFSETAAPIGAGARGELDVTAYTAGRTLGLLDVAGRRIGVSICFEAIYPELSRALAVQGATLLVNLSNDGWYRGRGGARQHLQQVVFRAIETGLPVARATTTGVTAVIAPDGAIRASLAEGTPGALRAPLPAPRAVPTVYTRVGDVFGWSCVAAAGSACAFAMARRVGRDTTVGCAPSRSHSSS